MAHPGGIQTLLYILDVMLNFQLRMYDKSLKVRLKKGTKNEERTFSIILDNNFKHDME